MRVEKRLEVVVRGTITEAQAVRIAHEAWQRFVDLLAEGGFDTTCGFKAVGEWVDGGYVLKATVDTWRD